MQFYHMTFEEDVSYPCAPRVVVLMLEKELTSTDILSYLVGTMLVDCATDC